MTGSADLFDHDGRSPRASINHVTVHDGFTLADLVSYERKHNEANGEDNRDGSDDNHSTNCGVEGADERSRYLSAAAPAATQPAGVLMLAQGVPLLLAGDEVGNSQNGNNNAYCQDNPIGWVDWSGLGLDGDDMTGLLARPRRSCAGAFRSCGPRHWVEGRRPDGSFGVLWLTPPCDRDDRAGLEFSGRAVPVLRARLRSSQGTRRSTSCSTPRRKRSNSRFLTLAQYRRWTGAARHRAARHAPGEDFAVRRATAGEGPVGSGVFGCSYDWHACALDRDLHADGVTFRLWAPAAKRVELMLDRPHPMQAQARLV